jgi:hypothetical protein
MKQKGKTEKWITAGLGVMALVLVVNLIFRGKPSAAPPKGAAPAAAARAKDAPAPSDELTRFDPALQLDDFEAIQKRPASTLKRNPFEFVTREVAAAPAPVGTTAAPTPQAAAPPPPPPLKAVGYTQSGGGAGEAFVTLQDELFVVHEGESFGKHFRVNKLTPAVVEVFDETTQQIIRLPIGG